MTKEQAARLGVLAIAGTLGAILTGVLATASVNGNLTALLEKGGLFAAQLKAVGLTLVLAVAGSLVLAFATRALVGLRPTPEVERQGLDIAEHGEEGYNAA